VSVRHGITIVDENGNIQIIETTDSHPFWVVTDEPDLERAARGLVNENGVWLYHENIGPTENGFWVEANGALTGLLADGTKINIHISSSMGAPTLGIKTALNNIKIRYIK
jgi:hypothetical protein